MNEKIYEKIYYIDGLSVKDKNKSDLQIKEASETKRIINFKVNTESYGETICYDICPGITLIFNEFHILYKTSDFIDQDPESTILIINHCKDGRYECKLPQDRYIYIGEEDILMSIDLFKKNKLPEYTRGFHKGFSIFINYDQFRKYIIENYPFYLEILIHLYENIIDNKGFTLFHPQKEIKQVITDIYSSEFTRGIYYKIKVLELCLLLSSHKCVDESNIRNTYTPSQAKVVKKIKNDLSRDIASYVSLETLSKKYGINLTTLKNCFKDIYGKPLYAWYREYKFHRAKELIKNTDYTIARIADMVGYKSSSKFAKAFKKEMGVLPSSYRKKK